MDDVLFGENWNNQDINHKTRCIVTVVALMSSGITDSSLKYHLENAKKAGVAKKEIAANFRQLVIHHKIVYKPPIIYDDSAIIEELKDINKLENNLNQIARHLNQSGVMTDGMVKELQEALRLITGSCIKINKAVEEEYR